MLKLRWYGTAAIELECDEGKILFDPFVPLTGSDVNVKLEDYDGFADIIVTHGHFDHIASIPEIYRRNPSVKIHCTDAPRKALLRKGISEKNLIKITYGKAFSVNGFRIMPYHGKHAVLPKATVSRLFRILSDKNSQNVPGILKELVVCKESDETVLYQIRADGKTITLMGSMNLREEIDYPIESDALILPYNGWEDNYPPAVRVIETLLPKKVYLDHYDNTFPPVTSEMDLSPIIRRYSDRVVALDYGSTVLI